MTAFDPAGVRLVATDLDGTLLHTDGTVTDRTRRVIEALEARGVLVVFVTGRPVRWMETLWPHVGDHGLAICSNGAIVYDVAQHAVSELRPIPREVVLEVADVVRREVPGTAFAVERADGFGKEPVFHPEGPTGPDLRVASLEEIAGDGVAKLLARHEELDPAGFWARVEALVGGLVTTTWSSVGALVEMSAAGVTKATTLAAVCAEHGIGPEHVLAFGDMPNDLALLEWAGRGYAMANAHGSVLAATEHHAPPHDEDGVAQVLEDLFGL
ncbi:HAD family hydrolase [Nocardioides marmoribigeumensis]|uniref:Hydroxymethylpyrimidine pyrophosphatase-like HAD family hydrolase n=1 Tax=Nocardioides marmoribigeumensis TaxID=433649 RepID=A0ABU2BUA1_9ACTN|nr:HAD family hydrolase [Nocardioides marmoribigeumensis]MDR7362206.1 hydroxymethylpyrimidine pyrophosphatase-like HAD family hydrolase [Nocardioides marmoribigeumensis]